MKNKYLFISLFLFSNCMYYSFRGSMPSHIRTIYIAPIINESTDYLVSEIINDELNILFLNENILDLVSAQEADSRLEIKIKNVLDQPKIVSRSSTLGIEEVNRWELTIKSSVTWYDLKKDKSLLEKQFTNSGLYAPGVDISTDNLDNDGDSLVDEEDSDEQGSPRESAMKISIRLLTQDIISSIVNTW